MISIQWNPSCEATAFASEKWPFKRGGLSSVEINTFMFRFTLSSGLSRGGGLSKGVPLYFKMFRISHFPVSNSSSVAGLDLLGRCSE